MTISKIKAIHYSFNSGRHCAILPATCHYYFWLILFNMS